MSTFWQHDFQTTIDAYYAGEVTRGLAACERLLSWDDLPEETHQQVRRNQVFYAPLLRELAPSCTAWSLEIPVVPGWSRFNPSIAQGADGFGLILRSSNFETSPPLRYTVHDDDGIVRTTNYFVTLNDELAPCRVSAIDDRAFRPDPPLFPVAGFEDCRLFWRDDAWWVSATVRDRTPAGICQIALLRLEDGQPTALQLLSDGEARHEKNWMPVADGGEVLRFVYSIAPTVLLRVDPASGETAREAEHPAPYIARYISGGSQVIPIDGGYLCLGHDGVRFDDGGRVYLHRWLWFDVHWRLARLSPPFIFHERGVEFAAGLAQRGDDLVISYGVWDREAWLATVPLAEVLPLLAPPLAPEEAAEAIRSASGSGVAQKLPDRATAPEDGPGVEGVPADGDASSAPLTIVSTTITGNSAGIIGDALRSVVDWVDWCLVIDTGISDDTLDIARDIAGDKLVLRAFPWCDDFAAARNFALAAAAELGADWAVTLDADERIALGGVDPRLELTRTRADSLHVKHRNATYGKERFFRLPARGQYVGPTHEAFIRAGGGSETLAGITFDELGKTRAQYRRKAERDVAILTRHTAEHPHDPRWFYYLGDSLAGLGRHDEAIAAFRVCASLNGWDEEGAWAMYRAAECLLKLDRPAEAIEACAVGMARHAGLGELPWLAGYAAWQGGKPLQAAAWARVSIALGHYQGIGATIPRTVFRHPPGLWENPFDVLRFALRAIGDEAGALEAERAHGDAKRAREAAEQNA